MSFAQEQSDTLPPTTTKQEDVTLASQRRINLIWEITQALIAVGVVASVVGLSVFSTVVGRPEFKVPEPLTNALFLIVGFYFSRTNHAAVGGIGVKKPSLPYEGR
jgi:hypothetical protein